LVPLLLQERFKLLVLQALDSPKLLVLQVWEGPPQQSKPLQ
jgi:hypothetical protein